MLWKEIGKFLHFTSPERTGGVGQYREDERQKKQCSVRSCAGSSGSVFVYLKSVVTGPGVKSLDGLSSVVFEAAVI